MPNNTSLSRRKFNHLALTAATALTSTLPTNAASTPPKQFFTIRKIQGHSLLATPQNKPFFAISFNHIDSSALRYPENIHIWRDKYNSSEEQWIKQRVVPDLKSWGFNSIGWTQEVVVRENNYHWHSPNWSRHQYRWAQMPYFHTLPFLEAHRWKIGQHWPDVYSTDFAAWCDYVARENCAVLAEEQNLIGYYFTDVPLLVKKSNYYKNKPTIFDPALLDTESGLAKIAADTHQYYKVTTDAVRRYDKNHLIFGDRYDMANPMPECVIDTAARFIDALAVQLGGDLADVSPFMTRWAQRLDLPFIIADMTRTAKFDPPAGQRHDPVKYNFHLNDMRHNPHCIGVNLCGGFVRNRVRNKGVYNEHETPDQPAIDGFIQTNRAITDWYTNLRP